jgi:hypothetical protein
MPALDAVFSSQRRMPPLSDLLSSFDLDAHRHSLNPALLALLEATSANPARRQGRAESDALIRRKDLMWMVAHGNLAKARDDHYRYPIAFLAVLDACAAPGSRLVVDMFARATPVPAAHVIRADADVVMMFGKQQVLRRTWINRLYKVYYPTWLYSTSHHRVCRRHFCRQALDRGNITLP